MTKPWLGKVGALFIQKRGCIVSTHPHFCCENSILAVGSIPQIAYNKIVYNKLEVGLCNIGDKV